MADVNICPKCASISLAREYIRKTKADWPADEFTCRECGYYGTCPIIDEKDIEEFKKELNEKSPV